MKKIIISIVLSIPFLLLSMKYAGAGARGVDSNVTNGQTGNPNPVAVYIAPTLTPSNTPTPVFTPASGTNTWTPTPTGTGTNTFTPTPTITFTPTNTGTPTNTPTPVPTLFSSNGASLGSSPVTIKTGSAGVKWTLRQLYLGNSSASAVPVTLSEGTTVRYPFTLAANSGGVVIPGEIHQIGTGNPWVISYASPITTIFHGEEFMQQ